jgi:hypothetical protein
MISNYWDILVKNELFNKSNSTEKTKIKYELFYIIIKA